LEAVFVRGGFVGVKGSGVHLWEHIALRVLLGLNQGFLQISLASSCGLVSAHDEGLVEQLVVLLRVESTGLLQELLVVD